MSTHVIIDFDNTLSSEEFMGATERPLFFPETIKLIIEENLKLGNRVVIVSRKTPKESIEKSLQKASIDFQGMTIYSGNEYDEQRRIEIAQSLLVAPEDKAYIVDDSLNYDINDERIAQILVPINPDDKKPASDTYFLCTLKPFLHVASLIKSVVKEVRDNIKGGEINVGQLDKCYKKAMSQSELINQLEQYQTKRMNDKREYHGFFAKYLGHHRSKAEKLTAVKTVIDSIKDGSFDSAHIPEAAKNGELKQILKPFLSTLKQDKVSNIAVRSVG